MATTKISEHSQQTLRALAEKAGDSMSAVLDKAIEEYRRHQLLLEANQAFAILRSNPEAWAQEQQEREEWEGTIIDGIDEL